MYAATDAWVCREMYLKLLKSEKHPLTPEELNPPQPQPQAPKEVQAAPEVAEGEAKPKKRRRRHRRKAKKPQEVWTAKKDGREFCLDPQLIKGMSVGEKTRMQKRYQKKATDERIRRIYDPSSKKSVQDYANICGVSKGRMEQWLQEFCPKK